MKMGIEKFIGIAAAVFYILCWFTNNPPHWQWAVGISLPWLSLALSVPLHLIVKSDKIMTGTLWAYTYAIVTIIYVATMAVYFGNIYRQIPYLAACVCFITEVAIKHRE